MDWTVSSIKRMLLNTFPIMTMYNIYFYEKFEWDYVKTIDGMDSFPIGFYTLSFGGKCLEFLIDTNKNIL
jgi:hypothetical protein